MPLLTNIERRSLEQGLEKGAKQTSQKHLLKILQQRFGKLPEQLVDTINQIDNLSHLEDLIIPSITVNSLAEFEQLIHY